MDLEILKAEEKGGAEATRRYADSFCAHPTIPCGHTLLHCTSRPSLLQKMMDASLTVPGAQAVN